mmetsp:Transcript_3951/g.11477  ORF Transcript_3951/g.11477 Transcript_3951/m.11477 type:complete len:344 (+) Transcript_3951:1710-2741(+)
MGEGVDVRKELDHLHGEKAMNSVDHDLLTVVDKLHPTEIVLVHFLVHLFVIRDPLLEVRVGLFPLLLQVLVVRQSHLGVPDVLLDRGFVRADALDENDLQREPLELGADPLSPGLCGVGRVKEGNLARVDALLLVPDSMALVLVLLGGFLHYRALAQILQGLHLDDLLLGVVLVQELYHVVHRHLRERSSELLVLLHLVVKKVAAALLVRHVLPSVLPHVEHLGPGSVEEGEVPRQPPCHVGLPPRRKPDHHDDVLLAHGARLHRRWNDLRGGVADIELLAVPTRSGRLRGGVAPGRRPLLRTPGRPAQVVLPLAPLQRVPDILLLLVPVAARPTRAPAHLIP